MGGHDSDDIIDTEARLIPSEEAGATLAGQQQSDADVQGGEALNQEGEPRPSSQTQVEPGQIGAMTESGDEFWGRVRHLLDGLGYPAWIENRNREILFSNAKARRDEGPSIVSIKALCAGVGEEGQVQGVKVYDLLRGWVNVSVKVYPLSIPVEIAASVEPIRLLVACFAGEERLLDDQLIEILLSLLGNRTADAGQCPLQALTTRQKEIFRRLNDNMSYKEIASDLGLAHATVRVQVAEIRKRLGKIIVPVLRQASE